MSRGRKSGKVLQNREKHVPLSEPRRLVLCKGLHIEDLAADKFSSGCGRREKRLQHTACAVPLPALPTGRQPEQKTMDTNLV